jgi:hypothetical protein
MFLHVATDIIIQILYFCAFCIIHLALKILFPFSQLAQFFSMTFKFFAKSFRKIDISPVLKNFSQDFFRARIENDFIFAKHRCLILCCIFVKQMI